jgi:hypothetical protein
VSIEIEVVSLIDYLLGILEVVGYVHPRHGVWSDVELNPEGKQGYYEQRYLVLGD